MKKDTNYSQALDLINKSHYILIVTHINPDADTISCALALSNYFYENRIKHKVFNKMSSLPRNLDFLSKFDKITDQLPKFYDLIIYVDCGDIDRPAVDLAKDVDIINIDHHSSNDNFGTVNIVDDKKASAAEVLYMFFKQNSLKISKQTAECLYTGIYDDSIQFSTPRTDANTFKIVNELVECGVEPSEIANKLRRRESLAKYRLLPRILDSLELHFEGEVATIYVLNRWLEESGADYRECEDAVNMILNIAVVNIAIFLRVSNGMTRVSLRSKKDDVSEIAKAFNGGGHTMAAGCSCDTIDVIEAKNMILEYISKGRN
ncbi:MAG: bifunctional oligoribonuclease/PAP phosphatase NrnA [Arcobacteraceae bacterium]|nr:bifunctional oligoribonuclease/PAP phosphatase NrnA [Arcobacteraceae bacterium]